MNDPLFQEFEEVTARQWKQKIQYELKGEDYNEKLVQKTRHGIAVKPFYHSEDISGSATIGNSADWEVCERIYVASAELSNKRALKALEKGAESLWFIISSEDTDPETLFRGITGKDISLYLGLEFLSESYIKKLLVFFSNSVCRMRFQLDIIGNLVRTGNWYKDYNTDVQALKNLTGNLEDPGRFLSIDAALYQNAGASIPQELAYALAHCNEYFNLISAPEGESEGIQFLVSMGQDYFFELAKLRALRLLYASLAPEYGWPEACHILASPGKRDKTLYDYNVNLLRSTTQSMSAALGGADAVYNLPYDAIYHKNNEFGDRIARNQLLVLKHESYFDKVSNPAEGSYYIESLTEQLAQNTLEIFKDIEKGGGFLKQLREGVIQRKIAESAEKEQEQFDKGELVLIGTNKYQNPQDRMKDELELYPFLKHKPRKTLIPPVIERRLAEKTEQERLKQESEL